MLAQEAGMYNTTLDTVVVAGAPVLPAGWAPARFRTTH